MVTLINGYFNWTIRCMGKAKKESKQNKYKLLVIINILILI